MAFSAKRTELIKEIDELHKLQSGANQKASLEGWTRQSEGWYEMRDARISALQRKLEALEQADTPNRK
jgi:hypothetical protein